MNPKRWRTLLLSAGILLASIYTFKSFFAYPLPDNPYDARNVFLAGKLMLSGQNPYNDRLLKSHWLHYSSFSPQSGKSIKPPGFPDCGMIYPFWSIPLLWPYYCVPEHIGAHTWQIQKWLVYILSWLLLLTTARVLSTTFTGIQLGFWTILTAMLAFKSGAVAVMLGQPLLFSMLWLVLSWNCYTRGKDALSGLFMGLALVKVTVCIPFLLVYLAMKKWKILLYSGLFPTLGALIFYLCTGSFYLESMLYNMSHQLSINYAGNAINAVNSNLTELGILLNFFVGIDFTLITRINLLLLLAGALVLFVLLRRSQIEEYNGLGLLILWNFLFSYHLIYDVLLLVFCIPVLQQSKLAIHWWLLIFSPLFLPVNGLLGQVEAIQFHLPVTLFFVFLFMVYDSILQRRNSLIS